jgi:hypothetical protein
VTFVDGEVPTGSIDGSNVTFGLGHPPSGSLHLYLNGLRQIPTTQYSVTGPTITMVTAPTPGSTLLADYRY